MKIDKLVFKGDDGAEEYFWTKERKSIFKGIIYEHQFPGENLEKERRIRIYMPYGYKKENPTYKYLILTDGDEYINVFSAVTVLDNLIADEKIPPIVTIFIDSTKAREEKLSCNV